MIPLGLVLVFGGALLVSGAVHNEHPWAPVIRAFGGEPPPPPGASTLELPTTTRTSPQRGPRGSQAIGRADGAHLWLTAAEVAQVARAAGFTRAQTVVMVPIAFRESRFDAHAVNPDPGTCGPPNATGLWQICPGGPAYLDPWANGRAARAKYLAAGFRPWVSSGPVP